MVYEYRLSSLFLTSPGWLSFLLQNSGNMPLFRCHRTLRHFLVRVYGFARPLYVFDIKLLVSSLFFFAFSKHILHQSQVLKQPKSITVNLTNFDSAPAPARLHPSIPGPPSLPLKMNILTLITALLMATSFPRLTIQTRIAEKQSTNSIYCVSVPRRHTSATMLPRMQRPRPDDVSLSVPALSGPSTSTTNNITKDNNSTSHTLQVLPTPPAWVLTLEDLITAIFRVVITILTLFNVNITWRIRGECYRSPARHQS